MNFQKKTLKLNGESYTVQELSARQRKEALKLYKEEIDPIDMQANYIQMGVIEFKETPIEKILDLPGTAFTKLVEAVTDVSGLTDAEEVEKNS